MEQPSDPERAMLALLVHGDEDHEGLIAFTLHRRAVFDWQDAYRARHQRDPSSEALADFLLGEQAERRILDYRERANLMLAMPAETTEPFKADKPNGSTAAKKQPLRTWFWPWGTAPGFVVDAPEQPLNWKGLFLRLVMLLAAVIVTALLLRVFVVQAVN
jgi:hypothetical protein